jgi:sugar/nucleoside kinase (ribokinase family)/nucleoside phosphorylase
MAGYILVVGSAHLDVLADYSKPQRKYLDKVGEVHYAIGGTAFNIAAHLADAACSPAIWTVLSNNSLITPVVRQSLERHRIDTRFVDEVGIPDSGFIAHTVDGSLAAAVTSASIEQARFDEKRIDQAIKNAEFVVADCNLSSDQLQQIADLCLQHERRLLLSAVSQEKALRIRKLKGKGGANELFEVVTMNEIEANAVGLKVDENAPRHVVMTACTDLFAKNVVVTRGARGYVVLSKEAGTVKPFSTKPARRPVSDTGAGDAVMAAICKVISKENTLNWPSIHQASTDGVSRVLKKRSAYPTAGVRTDMALTECFDVVVVCALHDPELRALRGAGDWEERSAERVDPTSYLKTTYQTKRGASVKIIAAAQSQMGMPASASLATKMIYRFRPKLVVMVGIAAGIRKDEQGFGDILAATQTVDYSAGKEKATSGGLEFAPDPMPLPLAERVVQRLRLWRERASELDAIRARWAAGNAPATALKLHVGPLASGPRVLASEEGLKHKTVTEIEGHYRKLMGVEMEAHGVHLACQMVSPQPLFLCLKSACDFIEGKHDDYQPYAAYTSAQFFHRFIVDEWETLVNG